MKKDWKLLVLMLSSALLLFDLGYLAYLVLPQAQAGTEVLAANETIQKLVIGALVLVIINLATVLISYYADFYNMDKYDSTSLDNRVLNDIDLEQLEDNDNNKQ